MQSGLPVKKTDLAGALVREGRYLVKRIAGTMGVSRSNQDEQHCPQGGKRFYKKSDDERNLAMIRKIMDERATYGYRRVTALLKRELGGTISGSIGS
jgi:hypothetical protein